MKINSPNEWRWTIWPHFVELLRAFALDDAEQADYFPTFDSPRHFDLSEGAMHAEDALRPIFSEMCYWAETLSFNLDRHGSSAADVETLDSLSAAFADVREKTWRQGQSVYHSRTDWNTWLNIRPNLRELCLEALKTFDQQVRAPETKWCEIIIP